MSDWSGNPTAMHYPTSVNLNMGTGHVSTNLAGLPYDNTGPYSQYPQYYSNNNRRLSNISNLICIPEEHTLPSDVSGVGNSRPCYFNIQTNNIQDFNGYSQSGASNRSSYGSILTTSTNDQFSNGYKVSGGGIIPRFNNAGLQDHRLSVRTNTTSLFDVIAKGQSLQNGMHSKSTQGSISFNNALTRPHRGSKGVRPLAVVFSRLV